MTNHMDAQKEIIELHQQNADLVAALRDADIFLTEFKEYGDAWDINKHNALRKIRIALAQAGE